MLRLVLIVLACVVSPILAWFLWMSVVVLADTLDWRDPLFTFHGAFGPWFLLTLGLMALLISLIRRFVRKPSSN